MLSTNYGVVDGTIQEHHCSSKFWNHHNIRRTSVDCWPWWISPTDCIPTVLHNHVSTPDGTI